MGIECRYSFDDLHIAARGRPMTSAERDSFSSATQDERNQRVAQWVEETGGVFSCEERLGSDGQAYLAFWGSEPRDADTHIPVI